MQRSSVQPKKVNCVQLWIFLQNFAGVKEIIEPEPAGFSTSSDRVLSVHQGARHAAASTRPWTEK
jgi:hypothetical protein